MRAFLPRFRAGAAVSRDYLKCPFLFAGKRIECPNVAWGHLLDYGKVKNGGADNYRVPDDKRRRGYRIERANYGTSKPLCQIDLAVIAEVGNKFAGLCVKSDEI